MGYISQGYYHILHGYSIFCILPGEGSEHEQKYISDFSMVQIISQMCGAIISSRYYHPQIEKWLNGMKNIHIYSRSAPISSISKVISLLIIFPTIPTSLFYLIWVGVSFLASYNISCSKIVQNIRFLDLVLCSALLNPSAPWHLSHA